MFNHSGFGSSDLINYKKTKVYSYLNEIEFDIIVITASMKVYIVY